MVEIEWTSRAFVALEELPPEIAFTIIRQTDALSQFPALGAKMESRFSSLQNYRQLIVKRNFRVIYEFDEFENRIYILNIQNCRQQLPSPRDLKRKQSEED